MVRLPRQHNPTKRQGILAPLGRGGMSISPTNYSGFRLSAIQLRTPLQTSPLKKGEALKCFMHLEFCIPFK